MPSIKRLLPVCCTNILSTLSGGRFLLPWWSLPLLFGSWLSLVAKYVKAREVSTRILLTTLTPLSYYRAIFHHLKTECPPFMLIWVSPVCGSDGKTYRNEGLLKYHACETGTEIEVVSKGKCPKKSKQLNRIQLQSFWKGKREITAISTLKNYRAVPSRLRDFFITQCLWIWWQYIHQWVLSEATRLWDWD